MVADNRRQTSRILHGVLPPVKHRVRVLRVINFGSVYSSEVAAPGLLAVTQSARAAQSCSTHQPSIAITDPTSKLFISIFDVNAPINIL